jgi:hypothetical protein
MIACAVAISAQGTFTASPAIWIITAAASGPSMKAAGHLAHCSAPPGTSEAASSIVQRHAAGNDRSGR